MRTVFLLACLLGALTVPLQAQGREPTAAIYTDDTSSLIQASGSGPVAQSSASFWAKPHYVGRPTRRQIRRFLDYLEDGRSVATALTIIFGAAKSIPGTVLAGALALGVDRMIVVTQRALKGGRGGRPVRFDAGSRCGTVSFYPFFACYPWFTARARK